MLLGNSQTGSVNINSLFVADMDCFNINQLEKSKEIGEKTIFQ